MTAVAPSTSVAQQARTHAKFMGDLKASWRTDPDIRAALVQAGESPEFQQSLAQLTAVGQSVRGCGVNPDRAHLQALHNLLGWTIGGYDTRPTEDGTERKSRDRLRVLLRYRQPADPGTPPRVAMYDYLVETLFAIPMKKVGQDVVAPPFIDLDGETVTADWHEADWDVFTATNRPRPSPVFQANRYPYQLQDMTLRSDAHEYQKRAQHWILWYFHFPWERVTDQDPGDACIDADVRAELAAEVKQAGFECVDYIWYRNPGMSVPDVFHVQVFFVVPD